MRIFVLAITVLALLSASVHAWQVAGDIGPGKNGVVPVVHVAGDIGPGKNGVVPVAHVAGDIGPGKNG